jgi:glucans biosynthesis protein
MLRRRDFLQSAALLSTLSVSGLASAAEQAFRGPASPFDYAVLKGQARALASKEYEPPSRLAPKALEEMTYDEYQSIRFKREDALWADMPGSNFRLEFFHMGRGFKEPVRMHEIVNGQARELLYRPELFDLSKSGVNPRSLPKDLAWAGFRIHTVTDWKRDVAAFLGASYFRSVGGDTRQFGLSARGLAIDTALDPEEFPRFSEYFFERPAPDARTLVIYGLMDSPSVAGAYRFAVTPGAPQIIEVDAAIYPRKAIRRLGIAPLTSMYQVGENNRRMGYDWRPEIHDSDGLSMYRGNGEWLWRPISNPPLLRFNSYLDENPRGFGLLQRDRDFNNYQDDGVFYERRPSLWIEPKSPGARARCSSRKFRRWMKRSTTSSRSGIRRRPSTGVRSCCTAIACTGARRCPCLRISPKWWQRAPASAVWWDSGVDISRGALRSTSKAASSRRCSRPGQNPSRSSPRRAARSRSLQRGHCGRSAAIARCSM